MIVEYHELARKEVIETTEHYARIRPALGAEFLAEFMVGVDAILTSPESFQQVRQGIRCYLLERFPYGIYYRDPVGNVVRVITLRHHSRRPGLGLRRK